jgi:ATP/ADP translocase
MFKKWFFPIKREEWFVFGCMFLIVCLINVNFSILRSMRNALVVADTGGSAAYIPYFELFGTFPASIAMTWGLSRLMRKYSSRFTFSITMLFFLLFFIVFAYWIYPNREFLGLSHLQFSHWPDMVFYIMSELWKVALLSVIFWGFLNQNLSLDQAKRFYPPLLLGSSIGTIISGPVTVFCTSAISWKSFPLADQQWQHSLYMLTFFLIVSGVLSLITFSSLFKRLKQQVVSIPTASKPFSSHLLSITSSLRYLVKSPYLSALMLIVVAEYVSYALGELIFLETLKSKYPTPSDYCKFMGNLSFWMGILTALSALFITPYLLQTYRWSRIALITPILMVLVTLSFFFVICFGNLFPNTDPITIAIVLGSIHFCIGRAAKYTLFDAIKELAFIPLNQEAQMKGKLIIDGIGSRLGRGTSSFLSIGLFLTLGGPGESALFVGILALSFALISIQPSFSIGLELEKSNATPNLQEAT